MIHHPTCCHRGQLSLERLQVNVALSHLPHHMTDLICTELIVNVAPCESAVHDLIWSQAQTTHSTASKKQPMTLATITEITSCHIQALS